jgi:hypothetical protein
MMGAGQFFRAGHLGGDALLTLGGRPAART